VLEAFAGRRRDWLDPSALRPSLSGRRFRLEPADPRHGSNPTGYKRLGPQVSSWVFSGVDGAS
jgi:hypothetical protein